MSRATIISVLLKGRVLSRSTAKRQLRIAGSLAKRTLIYLKPEMRFEQAARFFVIDMLMLMLRCVIWGRL